MTQTQKTIALEKAGGNLGLRRIKVSMTFWLFIVLLSLPSLLMINKQKEKEKFKEFLTQEGFLQEVNFENKRTPLANPSFSSKEAEPVINVDEIIIESSLESEEEPIEDFIIPSITEADIAWIVKAVQHEVRSSGCNFPNADIDEVQQIMTRVIINRVGLPDFGDSIEEVLFSGQFMPKEALKDFDPFEERTRRNVLTVLRGEDSQSSKVIFEMSFEEDHTFEESIEIMEKGVGPVIPYFWTTLSNERLLIFAERDEVRWAEMLAASAQNAESSLESAF